MKLIIKWVCCAIFFTGLAIDNIEVGFARIIDERDCKVLTAIDALPFATVEWIMRDPLNLHIDVLTGSHVSQEHTQIRALAGVHNTNLTIKPDNLCIESVVPVEVAAMAVLNFGSRQRRSNRRDRRQKNKQIDSLHNGYL